MKKKLNRHIYSLLLVGLAILPGCKNKEQSANPQPVQKAVPSPAQAKAAAVQTPISSAKPDLQAAGTLSFENRKDPFKPLITPPETATSKGPTLEKIPNANALPIQQHDAGKFQVTGIITGLKENKALIIDPFGKGYVVKNGMLVGQNGGHISRITSSSVEVTEQYRDEKRHIKTRKILLPLAKKSKETSR